MNNTPLPLLVGLGEVLWDVLPEGRKLGGAPANFAFHANSLGGRGCLVSRVGDDDLGRETLALLESFSLDTAHVSVDPEHPTGTVAAELDADGCASYIFPPDVAWDFLEANEDALDVAKHAAGVCFGTLAQRSNISRTAIHRFLDNVPSGCVKMLDVNLRGNFYSKKLVEASLGHANALKLSDEELPILAGYFSLPDNEEAALAELVRRFDLRCAALTRGGEGSRIVTPDVKHDHPGLKVEIQDTIGAGDSFTAATVLGLIQGWTPARINERAARAAAAVCAQAGAMVPVPEELKIIS